MRRSAGCVEGQPVAGERRPAEAPIDHAQILPVHAFAAHLHRLEPESDPAFDQRLRLRRAHCAVSKQMLIVPDSPAKQRSMIEHALLPSARIAFANHRDGDHDVDELERDGHRGSPLALMAWRWYPKFSSREPRPLESLLRWPINATQPRIRSAPATAVPIAA